MTMKIVELPRLRCYRCLHTWTPVRSPVRICPRCKSRLWDVPKIHSFRPGNGLGVEELLRPHADQIRALARRYGATSLRVFGSVRRHEAGPDSDIDLLVTWDRPSRRAHRADLQLALEQLLRRPVDLGEAESLFWSVRPQAEAEATPI